MEIFRCSAAGTTDDLCIPQDLQVYWQGTQGGPMSTKTQAAVSGVDLVVKPGEEGIWCAADKLCRLGR